MVFARTVYAIGTCVAGSPSPSPSPLPSTGPSLWLYVANQTSDSITTWALDPSTGAPSKPTSTPLVPGVPIPGASIFHVNAIAADPTGTILFAAGETTAAVYPPTRNCALLPIQVANGTLTPGTAAGGGTGTCCAVVVDPVSNVVFTANDLSSGPGVPLLPPAGSLSSFIYAPGTGALTRASAVVMGSNGPPASAAIDPTGTFLCCVNTSDTDLQAFPVDSGGFVPTLVPPAVVTTPNPPTAVAINPFNKTLYVGNQNGTVSVYDVGSGGATPSLLSNVSVEPGVSVPARNANVASIAVDPTGTILVTANGSSGDVSLLQEAGGGVPAPPGTYVLVGLPYNTPPGTSSPNPVSVVWNASGTVVYVANSGANSISALQVTSTGLTEVAGSPFALPAGDTGPASLAVSR